MQELYKTFFSISLNAEHIFPPSLYVGCTWQNSICPFPRGQALHASCLWAVKLHHSYHVFSQQTKMTSLIMFKQIKQVQRIKQWPSNGQVKIFKKQMWKKINRLQFFLYFFYSNRSGCAHESDCDGLYRQHYHSGVGRRPGPHRPLHGHLHVVIWHHYWGEDMKRWIWNSRYSLKTT